MSRIIKFRAWDKTNKKLRYEGFDISPDGNVWINQFSVEDQFIIMQYTGLKDKNGKEIYEGDIVRDSKDGSIGMVIYTAPMFSVKEKGKLDSEEFWNLGAGKVYPDNWCLTNTEVIGNIYENPKLMESK